MTNIMSAAHQIRKEQLQGIPYLQAMRQALKMAWEGIKLNIETVLFENEKIKVELKNEREIGIFVKATGKTLTSNPVHGYSELGPAHRSAIDALRAKGIDPKTKVCLGDIYIDRTVAEEIITKAHKDSRVKAQMLRKERENLAQRLSGLEYDDYENKYRAVESIGANGFAPKTPYMETEIANTKQALVAFDREHPEVIAQIRAEKAEEVERNMWN